MSTPPLIGITALNTQSIEAPHLPIHALNQRYVAAIRDVGGAPILLPPSLDPTTLRAIFERLDGLLLSGGGDVDPAQYGEAACALVSDVSAERDQTEMALVRWAAQDGKPFLCICRGIQVMNVALGGSLVQDIPTQVPNAIIHMPDPTVYPRHHVAHPIQIDAGTRLHEAIGVDHADVNSWHHQALKQVAPGVRVSACAPDGIVEAIELPDRRYAIGVQWHPEWLYDRQPEMWRLFEALVQAAA
jgi:putative glutamine amidotransferase